METLSAIKFDELGKLIFARKKMNNSQEIDRVIANTAEEFFDLFDKEGVEETTDEKGTEKKSEMPCNCHKEKVELKPCPFCGNKDLEIIPAGKGDNESMSMYQRIYCSGCQTMFKQMVDGSPEYLVQCWNTRNAEVAKAD